MKFYSDDDKITLVQSIASANTFVSSITGIIKNYILKAFPKNYFKYIYMDTAEAFEDINKVEAYNKNLKKINYPSLTISPQLSIDDVVGAGKNILISSPDFWIPKNLRRYYPCLLEDPNGKYQIFFSSDYITMNFRFKIIVDSFIQSTNVSYYLKSKFADNTFKYLNNQLITNAIPSSFINNIAKIENLFTNDNEVGNSTNVEDMRKLDILLAQMGRRAKTITRRRLYNNKKAGYFFEDNCNLLTLFTDLDIPEGVSRDGSVNGEYEINFRMQVSAWWPNAFMMVLNKDKYQSIAQSITVEGVDTDSSDPFMITSSAIGSPIALDRKDTIWFSDASGDDNIGLSIIHDIISFPSSGSTKVIDLKPIMWDYLNFKLKRTHSYAKENGFDLSKLLNIIARASVNGEDTTAEIDYDNLTATFNNNIDSDLVLDVFLNRAMFDSLNEDMCKDVFYSNNLAFTTLTLYEQDGDELTEHDIRVYAFKNEDEYNSTDISKMLRINTKYGIGFVGLVPEGSRNASPIKICIGLNQFGVPIIRCLEKVQ